MGGKLQPESIIWFQKDGFCLFQSVSDCPVRRLAEIPAFRMFDMSAAVNQCNRQICYRRAGQYAKMLFLHQMSKDEALPVPVQNVFAQSSVTIYPASTFGGFQ